MTKSKSVSRVTAYDPNFSVDKNGVVTEKYINNEDLTMFVDLAVKIPSRDYNLNNITGIDTLMGGTKTGNGSESYLTTDYITMSFTDIQNGAVNNREMFGVESIDISFDPYFFPVVTMSFIDVRGLSLMQPIDKKYVKESEALLKGKSVDAAAVFFEALFNFPYPTFTLTVKGYYGPIVSFDLRPEDFKSSFDATTGNFRCNIRFIGSLYGSLAEIPASYVLCAPYFDSKDGTLEGTVWKQKNFKFDDNGSKIPTILEIVEIYKTIVEKVTSETVNNDIVGDVAAIDNLIEELIVIRGEIEKYHNIFQDDDDIVIFEDDFFITSLSDTDINTKEKVEKTNRYTKSRVGQVLNGLRGLNSYFADKKLDEVQIGKYGEKESAKKIKDFSKDVVKINTNKVVSYSSGTTFNNSVVYGEDAVNIFSNKRVITINEQIKDYFSDKDKEKNMAALIGQNSETLIKSKIGKFLSFPCFYNTIKAIETIIGKLESDKTTFIDDKKEDISKYVEEMVGFKPNVKNVYKMYYAHLDVLITHIVNTVKSINVNEKRFEGIQCEFDEKTPDKKIYPFPLITKDKEGNTREITCPIREGNFDKSGEGQLINTIYDGVTGFGKKLEEYIDAIILMGGNSALGKDVNVEEKNKTPFKATHPADYFIPWEGGGPYDKSLIYCSSSNIEECKENIISVYFLRYLRYLWMTDSSVMDMDTFIDREVYNIVNAVYCTKDGVLDKEQKISILKEIASTNGDFLKITDKGVFKEGYSFGDDKITIYYDNGIYKYNLISGWKERFVIIPNKTDILKKIQDSFSKDINVVVKSWDTRYIEYMSDITRGTDGWNRGTSYTRGMNLYDYGFKYFPLDKTPNEELFVKDARSSLIPSYKTFSFFNLTLSERASKVLNVSNGLDINKITEFDGKKIDKKTKRKLILMTNFLENVFLNVWDGRIVNGIQLPDVDEKDVLLKQRGEGKINFGLIEIYEYNNANVGVWGHKEYEKSSYLLKIRLLEVLMYGAFQWYYENLNKKEFICNGKKEDMESKVNALSISSLPFWYSKDSRENIYYSDWQLPYHHRYRELFERWAEAEGTGLIDIGEGVMVYGFDRYFEMSDDKSTYFYTRRRSTNESIHQVFIGDMEFNEDSSNKSPFGCEVLMLKNHIYHHPNHGYMTTKYIEKDTKQSEFKKYLGSSKEILTNSTISNVIEKINTTEKQKTLIYYSIKNIYDKFLLNHKHNDFLFEKGGKEFEKVKFFNNFMKDISKDMMVPFDGIVRIIDKYLSVDKSPSFIELLAETAQINKCLFLATPFMTLDEEEKQKGLLFKPIKWWGNTQGKMASDAFIILQPGEVSRNLDTNCNDKNDYKNDGFDIANNYSDETPINTTPLDGSSAAFAVTYGIQNQNYFKNVTLNMDSPTPTDESIANLLDISKMVGDGAVMRPIPMKSSLYPVYANRTYNCTVDMMGNMGITPLMYFQLNNVPMFRGAYMITNVSHKITPRDFTTTFTGTRVSKYEIPLPGSEIFFNSLLELARKAKEQKRKRRGVGILRSGEYTTTPIDYSNGITLELIRYEVGTYSQALFNGDLEYTMGRLYVNGEYYCDTVEDKIRDLSTEAKVSGRTAIPEGTYRVITNVQSPRFKSKSINDEGRGPNKLVQYFYGDMKAKSDGGEGYYMPRLRTKDGINEVPHFGGILIHTGQNAGWSGGCIIVGFKDESRSGWLKTITKDSAYYGDSVDFENDKATENGKLVKRKLLELQIAIRECKTPVYITVKNP